MDHIIADTLTSDVDSKKASEYDQETPQSHNPRHREEEPQNTDRHRTSGRQPKQSNHYVCTLLISLLKRSIWIWANSLWVNALGTNSFVTGYYELKLTENTLVLMCSFLSCIALRVNSVKAIANFITSFPACSDQRPAILNRDSLANHKTS